MAEEVDSFDIEEFVINKMPPKAFYIPDFISADEEKYLLEQVNGAPRPKWTKLSGRRLQNWGIAAFALNNYFTFYQWLETYVNKVGALQVFDGIKPNHVLVNEYKPGQGIMPHEDGPLFYPVVSTINLGSHTFLDFYHPLKKSNSDVLYQSTSSLEDRYFTSVLLEPRSLFLLTGDLYHNYLHGIAERTNDVISERVANLESCKSVIADTLERATRISLTIRNVPKILKFKLNLGR
ncbi:PREDICTED: alpha-ketoglutarate-dependent dioxygenase alkB homolog 6-like [Acropora digitifera]|uniref:alpha-ketoglutarate-dependent dioxygenase alkB homolog 6-like n=1 Tax=Acropora digitifera TaxID=70779 RepID=UPI00077A2A3C|nr:PREDICTED: alpha-ketoglutarate-dependent dioxygenase alkB homolog 6-like [Acropora digitifera]